MGIYLCPGPGWSGVTPQEVFCAWVLPQCLPLAEVCSGVLTLFLIVKMQQLQDSDSLQGSWADISTYSPGQGPAGDTVQ